MLAVVDCLRADHLGVHGYERATTAFLDSLAARGVIFEEARTASTFTRESVAALFTGQLPSRSGAVGWFAEPPDAASPLATRLAAAGYRTGFLTTTAVLREPAFSRGFDASDHLVEAWNTRLISTRLCLLETE